MPPSTRHSDIKPTSERRQTYGPVRLGKSISGFPACGGRRYPDASIWVLVICIVVALILRTTTDLVPQEDSLGALPGAIRFLLDVEVVAFSDDGTSRQLASFAKGTEGDAIFKAQEAR